jgi:hypothetical protein
VPLVLWPQIGSIAGMIVGRVNPKCSEKHMPQFHFAHPKSHRDYLGLNIGLSSEKLALNCLSCGMALVI